MSLRNRLATAATVALGGLAAFPAVEGWIPAASAAEPRAQASRSVELLHGRVRSAAHDARGRAAVVVSRGRRVLTLRSFASTPARG